MMDNYNMIIIILIILIIVFLEIYLLFYNVKNSVFDKENVKNFSIKSVKDVYKLKKEFNEHELIKGKKIIMEAGRFFLDSDSNIFIDYNNTTSMAKKNIVYHFEDRFTIEYIDTTLVPFAFYYVKSDNI